MNIYLSGWAVAPIAGIVPQNLSCKIIDSTKIVAEYKTIENIKRNFDKIFPKNTADYPQIDTLVAWSMGAIIALGVLSKINAKKIILLSPTLKFVENEIVLNELQKLRKNILKNKETAIKLFSRNCGIPRELIDTSYYSTEELSAGLDFLEKTEIHEISNKNNSQISIICGENDKIISTKSSIEVAEKLGIKPSLIPSGSHFFSNNNLTPL